MNFLIVYGTTEGQTRKISEFLAERMRSRGHNVKIVDLTSDAAHELKLRDYDGVVIAASLHLGFYQAAVEDFVRSRRDTLDGMPTMFLSVSLAAASKDPEDLTGMAKCAQRFTTATSWQPGEIQHVIGAFRHTRNDFFKRWSMKLIAAEKGMSVHAARELELTDWNELASMADAFVTTVAKTSAPINPA